MGIELAALGPALQLGGLGFGALSAYNASEQRGAAYSAQSQIAANNAVISEWQAQDAEHRGDERATQSGIQTNQLKGTQRAAMAANGADLSGDSAQRILTDTDYFGGLDKAAILTSASREAWGYRMQGKNFTNDSSLLQSRADAESPWAAAAGSLLTGAGKVASSWYGAQRAGGMTVGSPGDGLSQGDRRKIGVY